MTKLLNLTIEIDKKDGYKDASEDLFSYFRIIEPTDLSIKDQNGATITQFKKNGGGFSGSNFSVSNLKKIKIAFGTLDIPISWAWENRGADTRIEFTLKGLKYDENKGLRVGAEGRTPTGFLLFAVEDTLFLGASDFEAEIFANKRQEYKYLTSIIELSDKFSADIKRTLKEFLDLKWKITKSGEEETINRLVPEIESYQNSAPGSLQQKLYQLKNIIDNQEEVKNFCQDFIKEVRELDIHWKKVGIKTLTDAQIAKENGFDITTDLGLSSQINSEGKYKGFYIANPEKYQIIMSGSSAILTQNRYTKSDIDIFRDFFTNDLNQSDPKYFRGFRPGDIERLPDGKFVSINHWADIRSKSYSQNEIEKAEEFSRTYYEIEACKEHGSPNLNDFMKIIFQTSDLIGKTKKEILNAIFEKWHKFFSKNKWSKYLHQKLADLLGVLDQDFVSKSRENCETALNILKVYENLPDNTFPENKIKERYALEIESKKNEITARMKVLFQADIETAMNEDYGFGSLSPERKKIFTTYRSQIETLSLLAEIKELIKILVKSEKFIAEFKNLDKMGSVKRLKNEYQNGSGDKKAAYDLVNQVDNSWVDRTITELEKITKKDPQILRAESRTQLKTKYANDAAAQVVFDNEALDSWQAFQAAEKLLIKVREAEAKNEVDLSLLTFLLGYQEAPTGTFKNKAWQAVNSYNQQAEAAITHLQKTNHSREEVAKSLQEAKNESELEAAYNQAKESELYKQGSQSKKVIRNLRRRKLVSFQLDQEDFSAENKIFLQTALVKLIPETLKDDNDEQELTSLENQLKTFQTASEDEEKGQIYQKYKKTIDQVLTEIRQERQRYQQTKQPKGNEEQTPKGNNPSPSSGGRLPDWAWLLVIMGVIVVIGTIFLYAILYFYQHRKRGNSIQNHKIKIK